jgi:AcrR family transcriptional regulator
MIRTPWGRAIELRERKLHPSSGLARGEVIRNQRERLFGALVAVVSEKGFESCTVADIIALSGVSRSAFYEHFANKDECLAAAAAELIDPVVEELRGAARAAGTDKARAIFDRFIELVCAQPAAAQVCFVELHAAGESGEEVAERGFEAMAQTIEDAGGDIWERGAMDGELVRVLIGGLRKVVHSRLYRGEQELLAAQGPELWRWIESVEPPPGSLASPRRQRRPPGTAFEGYTAGERIARAVAAVMAKKGFRTMSTDDIAAQASISLSTFYENFDDKRDAVLGALEMSGAQITALAVPAARRAGDWQEGVRALYEAICAYFAAEPAMAELATVGVYGSGEQALARRDRVIDSLTAMLAPGFEANPTAPPISAEASGAAVYALMGRAVRRSGPQGLAEIVPLATYLTLVPFVGPDRAYAVANTEGRGR